MATSSSSRIVLALLANLALAGTACGVFSSDDSPSSPETPQPQPQPGADGGVVDGPKAPPVGGPAAQNELTDELGVFVASNGFDGADGTHGQPLATIQAGIDKAKTVGKRVYVCAGTYTQALVLADSISVIGGLDCTKFEWRTGSGVSRIESPTSPAILAKNITSATRLEGLDVNAPNATAPSGSSIGLLADHATALVVARTKIVAGDAMKGDDGAAAVQLSNAATADGVTGNNSFLCGNSTCAPVKNPITGATLYWNIPALTPGGTNTCVGGAGQVAESGGRGGSGGLHQYDKTGTVGVFALRDYRGQNDNSTSYGRTNTPDVRTGAAGADGMDGQNGAAVGTVSADGYVPGDGVNGADGATGHGGAGGNGLDPTEASPVTEGAVWRGWMAESGGAGGCPGLAGAAGKGGGASIAALLHESPVTFDSSELVSGQGGGGGLGALGSAPTVGGAAGVNPRPDLTALNAQPGGRGGLAGVSGNGGNGPSAAIAHRGAAPILIGANKTTFGAGGAEIPARSTTSFDITKTIAATPAGASQAILPL